MAKKRTEIPRDIAALVLFLSDRTCCVCRQAKPVQIHHLDEDPSNHDPDNLAVLCFDCHRETQIRGGFDRKLDSDQIRLYRDQWLRQVASSRAADAADQIVSMPDRDSSLELATSVAEDLRDAKEYELLAVHYDVIGNHVLRDKYIELALDDAPSDHAVLFLRGLQGRPDLIPPDVADRELSFYTEHEDWSQRARAHAELGRNLEAAYDYIRGVAQDVDNDRPFSAAFYLKEIVAEGMIEMLLREALRRFEADGDLWWQVRCLQELGWTTELKALLIDSRQQIEDGNNLMLQKLLADAEGDSGRSLTLAKRLWGSSRLIGRGVGFAPVQTNGEVEEPSE